MARYHARSEVQEWFTIILQIYLLEECSHAWISSLVCAAVRRQRSNMAASQIAGNRRALPGA